MRSVEPAGAGPTSSPATCTPSQRLNATLSAIRRHAIFAFWPCLRSSRLSPRAPDGGWMNRTPVSRLFWFWPPLPPQRKVCLTQSSAVTRSSSSRMLPLLALVPGRRRADVVGRREVRPVEAPGPVVEVQLRVRLLHGDGDAPHGPRRDAVLDQVVVHGDLAADLAVPARVDGHVVVMGDLVQPVDRAGHRRVRRRVVALPPAGVRVDDPVEVHPDGPPRGRCLVGQWSLPHGRGLGTPQSASFLLATRSGWSGRSSPWKPFDLKCDSFGHWFPVALDGCHRCIAQMSRSLRCPTPEMRSLVPRSTSSQPQGLGKCSSHPRTASSHSRRYSATNMACQSTVSVRTPSRFSCRMRPAFTNDSSPRRRSASWPRVICATTSVWKHISGSLVITISQSVELIPTLRACEHCVLPGLCV